MPVNITDVYAFTSPVVAPVDGDAATAASVNTAIQALSNRTKYLNDLTIKAVSNTNNALNLTSTTAGEDAITGTGNLSGRGVVGIGGSDGTDGAEGVFGQGGAGSTNGGIGVYGLGSDNGCGVYGTSVDGAGIIAEAGGNGPGLRSINVGSGTGVEIRVESGPFIDISGGTGVGIDITPNTTKPPLRLRTLAAAPSGPNLVGDLYMFTGGVLRVCTVAGSPGTWANV